MTQEEKAKRYDEALEELRGLLEGIREEKCKILEEDITSIFPELQENEDERIRKELIFYLGDMPEDTELRNGVTNRDVLVWLEKQGEQKPRGKTALEAINEEKVDNANKVEPKDYSSIDPHFGKPIDKVEPKFKAGDWIVLELDNSVHQVKAVIENISNGKYVYDLTRGGYISSQDANFYHLWTIQDAKAGDILVCKGNVKNSNGIKYERICLFNNLNNAFFTLTKTSNYVEEYDINVNIDYPDDTIPATKEQRAILIKAMADAGYTFDFEKKELKKIDNETEIPYGSKDSELQEDTYYIPKGFHAEIDDDKVVIKKGEKPTAWSEEDEEILNLIIARLQSHADVDFEEYSKEYDWLNSPKVRSAWKPSDAQMIVLNEIITNGHLLGANEKILKGLQEQLKKL